MQETLISKFIKRRLYLPLILLVAFVVCAHLMSYQVLYFYFAFYAALLIVLWKEWIDPFEEDAIRLRDGKLFWIALALTVLGMVAAHFIRQETLEWLSLMHHDDGVIDIWVRKPPAEYALYAVTLLILQPVAECLFFRKALISFASKKETIITLIVSLVLYIAVHIDGWEGILALMIPAIPLSISYLATKNIFISIIAHVCFCFMEEFLYIVNALARMYIQ